MSLSTDFSPLCTALVGLQTLIEVPEGTNMPFGFVAHRAEFLATEEVNQIGFRYVIGAATDKMGHTVFAAPLVDGGFAVLLRNIIHHSFHQSLLQPFWAMKTRDESGSSRESLFLNMIETLQSFKCAAEFIKFWAYNKTSFALAMYKGGLTASNIIFNSIDFPCCILCIFLKR